MNVINQSQSNSVQRRDILEKNHNNIYKKIRLQDACKPTNKHFKLVIS